MIIYTIYKYTYTLSIYIYIIFFFPVRAKLSKDVTLVTLNKNIFNLGNWVLQIAGVAG